MSSLVKYTTVQEEDGTFTQKKGWLCPFKECGSRKRSPFSSERGARVHLSRQHNIDWRTGCGIGLLFRHWQT